MLRCSGAHTRGNWAGCIVDSLYVSLIPELCLGNRNLNLLQVTGTWGGLEESAGCADCFLCISQGSFAQTISAQQGENLGFRV